MRSQLTAQIQTETDYDRQSVSKLPVCCFVLIRGSKWMESFRALFKFWSNLWHIANVVTTTSKHSRENEKASNEIPLHVPCPDLPSLASCDVLQELWTYSKYKFLSWFVASWFVHTNAPVMQQRVHFCIFIQPFSTQVCTRRYNLWCFLLLYRLVIEFTKHTQHIAAM